MYDTINLWITDKNGGKHFHRTAGLGFHSGEVKNLEQHIRNARKSPARYPMLDAATAVVKTSRDEFENMSDEELLEALGA